MSINAEVYTVLGQKFGYSTSETVAPTFGHLDSVQHRYRYNSDIFTKKPIFDCGDFNISFDSPLRVLQLVGGAVLKKLVA